MNKACFFRFCQLFRDHALLEDTVHMCVEQQVAMFLYTVGHNVRNRVIATNFGRSEETISRYFYFDKVLHAIGELREDYISRPSLDTSPHIEGNPRWDPHFKVSYELNLMSYSQFIFERTLCHILNLFLGMRGFGRV